MLVFLVAAIVVFLVFGYLQLPLLWWTGAGGVLAVWLSAAAGFGAAANSVLAIAC